MSFAAAKLAEGDASDTGYLSSILYRRPHNSAGFGRICPSASNGCIASRIETAGRGRMHSVAKARIEKTIYCRENRVEFMKQLRKEIAAFSAKAKKQNLKPAVRLNGLSDISWTTIDPLLMHEFNDVQFYDYT